MVRHGSRSVLNTFTNFFSIWQLVIMASGFAVVHQPVDDSRGQGIVDIEEFAPFTEDAVGRDHDRVALVAGGDDLEHQIGAPFVDRQVA